jgi:S1-C subfamily serine protease
VRSSNLALVSGAVLLALTTTSARPQSYDDIMRCQSFKEPLRSSCLNELGRKASEPQIKPSFDCAKAVTAIETTVCMDPELSAADNRLSRSFRSKLAQLRGDDRRALVEDQRQWLTNRDSQCALLSSSPLKQCVLDITTARIATLQSDGSQQTSEQGSVEDRSPSAVPSPTKAGSGFLVNNQGYIVTNQHVVNGCSALEVRTPVMQREATLVASDETNDIAVLKSNIQQSTWLSFRKGSGIRPGDQVVLLGFPFSRLLTSAPSVTIGAVSALAGLHDDARFLQISAPVQPGNSGGPLLDSSGNVVGLAVATMNALAALKTTGFIPQNVNFAVKATLALDFLEARGISYDTRTSSVELSAAEIAEKAAQAVVLVECQGSSYGKQSN